MTCPMGTGWKEPGKFGLKKKKSEGRYDNRVQIPYKGALSNMVWNYILLLYKLGLEIMNKSYSFWDFIYTQG